MRAPADGVDALVLDEDERAGPGTGDDLIMHLLLEGAGLGVGHEPGGEVEVKSLHAGQPRPRRTVVDDGGSLGCVHSRTGPAGTVGRAW